MIKGVIFDLDGVVIETEPQTFNFFRQYLERYDIHLKNDDLFKKIGRKSIDFFHDVLSPEEFKKIDAQYLIDLKRQEFNKDLEKFTRKIPYAEKIIPKLKHSGMRLALASQNEREMIDKVLNWMGLDKYFDTILSLQDISNKKPHPEIYLNAIKQLSLMPGEAVVIEDSWTGITAAKAAGLYCVAIRHPYTPAEHIKSADAIIDSLQELPILLQNK
jgi:HAD superfamily hydrolase (TIGR01509 family)